MERALMDSLLSNIKNDVLYLTLNRPDKLNALTDDLLSQLLSELKSAERNSALRSIVILGAGKGFCAGQDLADFETKDRSFHQHIELFYKPLVSKMRSIEKPVLI